MTVSLTLRPDGRRLQEFIAWAAEHGTQYEIKARLTNFLTTTDEAVLTKLTWADCVEGE